MKKTSMNKTRLLQGASTVLLASLAAGQVHAQSVEISTVTTVTGVDSASGSDQANAKTVSGSVTDATNTLSAGDTTNGSLSIDGTGVKTGASAVGNTDTLSVTDTDGAANATTAAITANQSNAGTTGDDGVDIGISAATTDSNVKVTVGDTTGGNYTAKSITDTADATGNTVAQSLTLGATTLTLSGSNATANTIGATDATGSAIAASAQSNVATDVSATNNGSTITVDAGAATSSALKVDGNLQQANATGSTATNGLTLSGTTVGANAVIVSTQDDGDTSSVTAATTASALMTAASLTSGASAAITGNTIQSRAIGGTTTNTLSATATGVTLAAPDTNAASAVEDGEATVKAGYATLNDQAIAGDVSATTTAEGAGSAITLSVDGGVSAGSTLTNDTNTVMAKAQGAATVNTTTIAVAGTFSQGTTADGAIANAANITNVQDIASTADVTALVDSTSADSIATVVDGALSASALTTSSNKLQAYADGATATNTLAASATTFDLKADATGAASADYDTGLATADAAFSIANVQTGGDSTVSARIYDPATVSTTLSAAVSGSSVASNSNGIDAFASSNKAVNTLGLTGTTVETDAAILSAQSSNATTLATIGYPSTGSAAASPADAGVTIDIAGGLTDSSVAVNSNVTRGSAIANTSANTLTVAANTLNGDGTSVQGTASGSLTGGDANATADFALASSQVLGADSSSTTQIAASYGIDQANDQTLSGSRLSVSGNIQFG